MIANELPREYLICKECRPYLESAVSDMTEFISTELHRLQDHQVLKIKNTLIQSRKNEMKQQYFIISEFIKKLTKDLKRNDFEFIKSYIGDFMITVSANEYTSVQIKSGNPLYPISNKLNSFLFIIYSFISCC